MSGGNITSVVLVSGHSGGNSALGVRYDILMVVVFFLGIGLLNYLRIFSRFIKRFLCSSNARNNEIHANSSGQNLADTALNIIRDKKESKEEINNLDPLENFNQHIKDNTQNPNLEPIEVLNRMGKMGLCPDINTYNNLLNACIISKNFEKAYNLFTEMKESSNLITLDVVTYNIYIKGMIEAINSGEHINLNMIEELLKEMSSREIRPNEVTFNTIIDVCIITCRLDRAWYYFDIMQSEFRLSPDAYTFSIILKYIKNSNKKPENWPKFFRMLYSFMEKNPGKNDEILINSIIDACGKFGELDSLKKMRILLQKQKHKLPLVSYGKLISVYGQQKCAEKITEVHEEMIKEGITLNEVTYGGLLEAYLRSERTDKVLELYEKMKKIGSSAFNIVVYTTLIRCYAKIKRFDKVKEIYLSLKTDKKNKMNLIAYNAMLDSCVKCEQYEIMETVFSDLVAVSNEKEQYGTIGPDLITYSTLIKGLCNSGNTVKALELYEQMKKKPMEFDEVLFNSLLKGVSQLPDCIVRAEQLTQEMRKFHINFSIYTYSILIKLYTKAQDAGRALRVYEEMKLNHVTPGVIEFTCLLQVTINNKFIDQAICLFREMKRIGVNPDYISYNTIINGCIYSGRIFQACELLCEAISENIRVSDKIYNNALKNLLSFNCMNLIQKHNFASIICNYISIQKISVAHEVMQHVLQSYVFQQDQQQILNQPPDTSYNTQQYYYACPYYGQYQCDPSQYYGYMPYNQSQ